MFGGLLVGQHPDRPFARQPGVANGLAGIFALGRVREVLCEHRQTLACHLLGLGASLTVEFI